MSVLALIVFCTTRMGLANPRQEQPPADDRTPTQSDDAADDLLLPEILADMDLEQLMQIEVTSVSGTAQSLHGSPAAVFVISGDDIRRGGHRSIADALRMVPGMHVGQVSSNVWAVSSRGFNDRFANKLLVLIDGRSVYTPLFGGVLWDVQDVVMEDLDRIEVIRGPGATIWGSNAVNGVINIVTKSAAETQGLMLTGGGGNVHEGFGALRYGGELAENAWYRVYGRFRNESNFEFRAGGDAPDDWHMGAGGLRVDVEGEDVSLTVQTEIYRGEVGQLVTSPTLEEPFVSSVRESSTRAGGHVLARLEQETDPDTGWMLQGYYDRDSLETSILSEDRRTVDLEFRQWFPAGDRHSLIYGVGLRHIMDKTNGSSHVSFVPDDRDFSKYSAFLQDTMTLAEDRLSLMLGVKYEYNDFTGSDFQPGARLAWTPNDDHTFWLSASRAVRIPSRTDHDGRFTLGTAVPPLTPVPLPLTFEGVPGVDPEKLVALEAGYRTRLSDDLTVDLAAFFNIYDDLVGVRSDPLNPLNLLVDNSGEAEAWGAEVAATWQVADNWHLHGAYSWFDLNIKEGSDGAEGNSPRHQFNLRSHLDLTDDLELNTAAFWVDRLPNQDIDAYLRLDVGLIWRPKPGVEIAIHGQNLLDPNHTEFTDSFLIGQPVEVPRSIFGQVTLRY